MKHRGQSFEFSAIAEMRTPFKDRFGVPRQPGLAQEAKGVIKFFEDPNLKTALKTLEQFSHLWIVFVFHDHGGKDWKPSIRPPRLGGREKVGVLASRSPHRPNPIGISVVDIQKIDLEAIGGPEIHVGAVDLIDGTPVLDVKPYIPYADSVPEANAGWADAPIPRYEVVFSDKALIDISNHDVENTQKLKQMILDIVELDPRPAFQKRKTPVGCLESVGLRFGIDILNYDVKYELSENGFIILEVLKN